MQSTRTWGLIIGLVLGIVWAWLGFGAALLAGALAAIGWLIGTTLGGSTVGSFNIADWWNDLQGRRRASP